MFVSASVLILEIRQNMYNISEFRRENRPIFLFRSIKTPLKSEVYSWRDLKTDGPRTDQQTNKQGRLCYVLLVVYPRSKMP